MKYKIDVVRIREYSITLNGWAIGKSPDSRATFRVEDEKHKPVKFKHVNTRRDDVSQIYFKKVYDREFGFDIQFPYERGKDYYLLIRCEGRQAKIKYNEELIAKRASVAHKRMEKLKDLMNMETVHVAMDFWKEHGLKALVVKSKHKLQGIDNDYDYSEWYELTKPTDEELAEQRKHIFDFEPMLSVVIPAYKTPERYLREMLDSIMEQTYTNWEICVADGSPRGEGLERVLKKYADRDRRVRYEILGSNRGISGNTNAALDMARGDFVILADHDDTLPPNAFYEVVKAINENPDCQVIYSDEDKLDMDGKALFDPHFKPDFNQDLLNSNNYITHFLMVSRELLDQVGGINKEYDGAQDYDFILRCTELADNVIHIPKVLYHWRVHERSTAAGAGSKDYAIDAGKCAIESHLQRMGENGKVVVTPYFGFYRIEYGINTENKTEDYVLFADQSLKPLNADWKQILYADCSRKKIGVVGGKIYDRHHRIYEAAFFEKGDWTGAACGENVFSGLREGYGGYMHRANIQMDCDRVSEKCMLVKKEVLEQIEDYEQQIRTPEFSYIVCQKAKEMGYRIMYEPEVKMIFKS